MTDTQTPPTPPEDDPQPMLDPDGDGLPITPYDGGTSSGWSGSATSRERAIREDAEGVTAVRQRRVLIELERAGLTGRTVKELRDIIAQDDPSSHHGKVSSALSNLHGDGHIARLKERRDRCEVYVLPQYVNGRETAAHGRAKRAMSDVDQAVVAHIRDTLNTATENRRPVLILNTDELAVGLTLIDNAYGVRDA